MGKKMNFSLINNRKQQFNFLKADSGRSALKCVIGHRVNHDSGKRDYMFYICIVKIIGLYAQ